MAEQTIISKTSAAGQAIEIRIAPEWEGSSFYRAYGYLDGKRHGQGFTTFGQPKMLNGKTYVATVGKLALTTDEYNAVQTAIKAAEGATIEGRIRALRQEREGLRINVQAALDDMTAARERAFDEDTGSLWGDVTRAEAEVETAQQALREWDASHPEVIAAIKADEEMMQ